MTAIWIKVRLLVAALPLALLMACPQAAPQTQNPPAESDTTPPTVAAVQPASGAADVATNTTVVATLSESIDTTTVTATSFTLTSGSGADVQVVAAAVSSAGATATLIPSASLAHSTTYTATISTAVTDAAGNALATAYTWSFTTGIAPDTTAPSVATRTPADGASGVDLSRAISVSFDEALDPASVSQQALGVSRENGVPVAGAVTLGSDGKTVTFTPSVHLPLMTVCVVTLQAGVKDLAGNATTAGGTWSFTTLDGAWGTPEVLGSAPTSGYNGTPQVAFDALGTAHVLWSGYDAPSGYPYYYYTYASRYDASSSAPWSVPGLPFDTRNGSGPSSASSPRYTQPVLASNMLGTTVAVWQATGSSGDQVYWSQFTDSAWSSAQEISAGFAALQCADPAGANRGSTLHAAMDLQGNVLALVVGNDGQYDRVYSSHKAAGAGWSTPTAISQASLNSYNPFVAFDLAGNAHAVWMDYAAPAHYVYADRFDASQGSWSGSSKAISTDAFYDYQVRPRVAVDAHGNAMALWAGEGVTSGFGAHANRYDASTVWDAWASAIQQDLATQTLAVSDASVATDPAGNAVAAWIGDGVLRLRLFTPAGGWNATTVDLGTNVYAGRVAFDGSGNAVAVWLEYQPSVSLAVKAARITPGSPWAATSWVPAGQALYSGTPSASSYFFFLELAVDPGGSLIAVWCDQVEVRAAVFR